MSNSDTETSMVFDTETLSVTVHLYTADLNELIPTEAENVVVAPSSSERVIVSPETFVHAYVYGPIPPETDTVTGLETQVPPPVVEPLADEGVALKNSEPPWPVIILAIVIMRY